MRLSCGEQEGEGQTVPDVAGESREMLARGETLAMRECAGEAREAVSLFLRASVGVGVESACSQFEGLMVVEVLAEDVPEEGG